MTLILSRYAPGSIHGNVATGRANSLSVNSWAAAEGREVLSQYGLRGESKGSLSQSSAAGGTTTTAPASVAVALG
jgi:hypothetical protein